ncbi:glycosyltransferase family 87 protein [Spirosoma luteolum]
MIDFFRKPFFSDFRVIFGLYALLTLFASIRIVFWEGSNNYDIFYYSLEHLIQAKSLYQVYPEQYSDHYHYAPTFAALFSPIFALPYSVGLFIWHFLFTGVWLYAIYRLPLTHQQKAGAYWFSLHELFTSMVNSQTNPLIAALSIFAFLSFEKKQPFWAAFFIMIGFNIKIYSLVAAGLFIVYPQKIKFLASMVFWTLVLAALPLLFTTPDRLLWQYELWVKQLMIKSDGDMWLNISIHHLVHLLLGPNVSTALIIGAGVAVFCTVYAQVRQYSQLAFRLMLLGSVLIFQVIFNPVSESPTYITAVTGIICWWYVSPQSRLDWGLMILCFVLTVMSPSDIFPAYLRDRYVVPYALKALPVVLIWFRLIWNMHHPRHERLETLTNDQVVQLT